jgi:hypothetical protein
MSPKKHLGFTSLRQMLSRCFNNIPDPRQQNKTDYSLHDGMMSGFACMYFQDPSLLQFQKRLEKKHHKSNLQTLFDIKSIPESTQFRNIIDGAKSDYLSHFFDDYTHYLQRGKHLKQYQLFPELYYIPMDATDYFSSTACSCKKCLRTKPKKKAEVEMDGHDEWCGEGDVEEKKKGIRYSHKAVQIAIMHPDMKQVIPLMPEEVYNTDGATKQDCEMNAAKRLIPKLRKAHPRLGIIMGGDDLFSRQPIITDILDARMHYLFVAKPESHSYLMEWLAAYPKLNELELIELNKKKQTVRHLYQWMNTVPLHGGKDSINTNYIHYTMYTSKKNDTETVGYQNSWVTDIEVTPQNVHTLVKGGRCRWKIENECFNTLKNQGYCIDHSYGHGKENLAFNFYLLTLIAFAFHQIHELTDKLFQACRQHFGSKKHLWENIRANLRTFVFISWDYLFAFTLDPEKYITGELPAPA